jgi:hypothetical protein
LDIEKRFNFFNRFEAIDAAHFEINNYDKDLVTDVILRSAVVLNEVVHNGHAVAEELAVGFEAELAEDKTQCLKVQVRVVCANNRQLFASLEPAKIFRSL